MRRTSQSKIFMREIDTDAFLLLLESELNTRLVEVLASDVWKRLGDPATPAELVRDVYTEVQIEVANLRTGLNRALLLSPYLKEDIEYLLTLDLTESRDADEALHLYSRLTHIVRPVQASTGPRLLGLTLTHTPLSYLGAVLVLEALTFELLTRIPAVGRARLGRPQMRNRVHDPKPALHRLLRNILLECPEAVDEIECGMECFFEIYPLPVWEMVLDEVSRDHELSRVSGE